MPKEKAVEGSDIRVETISESVPSLLVRDCGIDVEIFRLPQSGRDDFRSAIAFAPHKSGSVLLRNILSDLCTKAGISFVNLPGLCFQKGVEVSKLPSDTAKIFRPRGYLYGIFRSWPENFSIPILPTSRPILLVRDPRDRLVSYYYSMLKSHPLPKVQHLSQYRITLEDRPIAQNSSVDEFAIICSQKFLEQMRALRMELCEKVGAHVYKYEDVVYDKDSWVKSIVRHYRWEVSDIECGHIAARHDQFPAEDSENHIRQVHPGDFQRKLKKETITYLSSAFAEEMEFFGYR